MSIDSGARKRASKARKVANADQTSQNSISVDISSGSQKINSIQSFLELTGSLSNDTVITINANNTQKIKNSTSGSFKLSVKRGSSGIPVVILQNETVEIR